MTVELCLRSEEINKEIKMQVDQEVALKDISEYLCDFFENSSYRYSYFKEKGKYLADTMTIKDLTPNGEKYLQLYVLETSSKKKDAGCCGSKGGKCAIF